MKKLIIALALSTIALPAVASDTRVDGYIRKDGTYVQPHMRTTPNNTRTDNYGSQGNVNPYTGQQGTENPYSYGYPQQSPQPRQSKGGYIP